MCSIKILLCSISFIMQSCTPTQLRIDAYCRIAMLLVLLVYLLCVDATVQCSSKLNLKLTTKQKESLADTEA